MRVLAEHSSEPVKSRIKNGGHGSLTLTNPREQNYARRGAGVDGRLLGLRSGAASVSTTIPQCESAPRFTPLPSRITVESVANPKVCFGGAAALYRLAVVGAKRTTPN